MADVIRPFSDTIFMWDENKGIANWKKHKVTFDTAIDVFSDENAVILPDLSHSNKYEDRKKIIGTVEDVVCWQKILFVVFIEPVRDEDDAKDGKRLYRIISARDATKMEAKIYERGISK